MDTRDEMGQMVSDALSRLLKENWDELQSDKNKLNIETLWGQIRDSGYLDILLDESAGGAGLGLGNSYSTLRLAGYYAVDLPVVTTILSRFWLYKAGVKDLPESISMASAFIEDGCIRSNYIPFVNSSDYVLVHMGNGRAALVRTSDLVNGSATEFNVKVFTPDSAQTLSVNNLIALCFSVLLAGAADRVLEITLDYASQRVQFGRNIGRFQAIQNQISSMAERIYAMRMAARMACNNTSDIKVAMSKMVCSESASQVISTSHAVHGAIGVTKEYHLQRFTKLMHEWRRIAGSESLWASILGERVLAAKQTSSLDFILAELS